VVAYQRDPVSRSKPFGLAMLALLLLIVLAIWGVVRLLLQPM
jgi:flagellar biogenesis protein FliO